MKKIIILLLLSVPLATIAQNSDFSSFYKKYSETKGYTSVYVTGEMIKLLGEQSRSAAELAGVESIEVIKEENPSDEFVRQANKLADARQGYKLVSSVNTDGNSAAVYFNESGGKSSCIVITASERKNIVIRITGNFDIAKIMGMSLLNIPK